MRQNKRACTEKIKNILKGTGERQKRQTLTTPMSDRNVSLPSGGRIIKFHSKETTADLEKKGSGKRRDITTAWNLLQNRIVYRNEHGNPWA